MSRKPPPVTNPGNIPIPGTSTAPGYQFGAPPQQRVNPLGGFMNLLNSNTASSMPQQANNFQPQIVQQPMQQPQQRQQQPVGMQFPPQQMTMWGGPPQPTGFYPQQPVNTINQERNSPSPPPKGRGRPKRQTVIRKEESMQAASPVPQVIDDDDEKSMDAHASDDGDDAASVVTDENSKQANSDNSDAEVDDDEEDGQPRRRRRRDKNKPRKRLFTRELKMMMFGFGDSENPLNASVELMDDLVTEYITEMTCKAMRVANKRGKLQTEDLVFLIRKDRKKFARAAELLRMNDEIKKARRMLDDDLLNPGNKKF
jgi:transcription initiation factor TFIID subunit 13